MLNPYATAVELLALLRSGEASALELTDMYLDRIEALNPAINAVVWQDAEGAREAARQVAGPPTDEQPLLGLPITVKEAYGLSGSPTTWGNPDYRHNVSSEDALAVQRLKAAGAIVIGKTNVPLNLADFQSYNDIYGQCNNPYNLERTPGGSSGGSAAALAAGMTALEMGSDIGGSIRTPAHFSGVFGHKPTWALVPSRGHALPGMVAEPDIAVIGPLARSAFDLELQLDIVAGADDFEPGIRYELPGLPEEGVAGLRIGVWANDAACPVSRETEDRVVLVADALRRLGATVDMEAKPDLTGAESDAVYRPLLWSLMTAGSPKATVAAWEALAESAAPDDDGEALRMARAATMDHTNWLRLNHARDRLRWKWQAFFQRYDALLAPQFATPAIAHDHRPFGERTLKVDSEETPYFQHIFWAGLTGISRLPSTVVPTGLSTDGLPIGIQIVGNAHGDRLTIQVAQALETAGFRFEPPAAFPA